MGLKSKILVFLFVVVKKLWFYFELRRHLERKCLTLRFISGLF